MQHEDRLYSSDQFPFTYATTTDPLTGKTDGLLAKCTKSHSCPKIFQFDSDTEVWQRRVSLVFTDTTGKPVPIPDNVRVYMPTGVPHDSNDLSESIAGTADRGHLPATAKPAALSVLRAGIIPGAGPLGYRRSRTASQPLPKPQRRHVDHRDAAGKLWPGIPGVPFNPEINRFWLRDNSHEPPTVSGPEYPIFVARTNADGNPIGGIEPPEIKVPLGTYSGRNFRARGLWRRAIFAGSTGATFPSL